ncbi:hypothetical protein [Serratia marcescens]|uniref:hypothetical protein n=2 Tax=Bacteria TaxID=2 RepID=UPI001BAE5725|nr:hypothetical protein [Serratia marcescens]
MSKKFTVGKVAEEAGWEGGSKGVSLAENALGRGSNKSDIVAASDNGEIAKEGVGKNNIVAFKGTDAHITHNGSAESNGNNQTKIDKRSANHATAGGSGSTESEASSPNRVLKRPKRHPLALSKSRARYEQGHAFSFDPQFMGKTIEFTVPRKGGKTDIYTYTMGKGDPKQVVHDMGVWINNTIDGLKFGKLIGPWGPISPEASHSSNYFWQIIESDIIDYHYKYVVEKEGENSKGTSKGENTLAMINKPISKGNEVRNVQRNNNYLSSNAPLPSIYDASDKKTSDESYINLSEGEKKITYLHAINDTLDKIGRDSSIPLHARQNAHRAKIGMPIVTPVDIDGFKMANTFFIPDTTGSKRGVLVNLNAKKKSYIYIRGPSDFPMDLASNFSNNNIEVDGGLGVGFERNDLDESGVLWGVTRSTDKDFEDGFNKENNKPMSIYDLSENLADSVKAKYVNQPNINHNKYVVEKAISGTKIPTPGISVSPATYSLRYKWASLRVSQYLRSVVNPFSTLGGQVQLVVSSINNDSIQDTDETIKKAEYIGSWVDATTGTVISFSPAGIVLNVVQSAAGITADLAESKTPDPLDTAGLVMSCIPGGKISARIGKFSKVGEKGVKYFLLIAEKTLDLAELSRSIKTAVDTGEPLAIYQAFLASGMSVKNAYDMAKNMSSELKLGEMASLEKLEAIHNNTPESSLTSTMQARTFRMGSTEMLGRINNAEIEISMDKGATWVKGSKLHLLTYRLQNAGGGLKFPSWGTGEIVIGEHTFKRVTYSKDKMHEMRKISTSYDTTINVRVEQDYRKGKEMSHATQYDHYNSLSLDEKLDLFNNQSTNALTRGVLAGKINESILKINAYEVAKGADSWRTSANKATKVVLAPQNIFLKGRQGECLPVCVLMGWALQSGQDAKLVKKLMNIPSSASISDNPLYKSLVELHANGNSSKFAARAISDVKMSALSDAESRLFPTENSSVRVDIPAHTMLISKVTKGGKVKYVFYDPNYGLAYFDKYKDMCAFFKKKLEDDYQAENYTTFSHLDYSRLPDVKILGKDLNEIISDTEQPDSGSKQLNAPASGHVQPPSAPASSIARTGVADQPHTDSIQAGGSGKVNQIFQRPSDTKRTEPVKEEQQQSNPKPVQPRNDVQYSYSTKRGQSYYDVLDYYTKQSRYADKQKFYSLNKHNIPKNMPDPDNQALPEGTIFQIPPLLPQPKIAKDDDE